MSHNRNVNLLITCVGGDLGPELLIQIRKSKNFNYRIVGVDSKSNINARFFCDKFYSVPPGSKQRKFVDKILQIVRLEEIDFIIPSADEEAIALSLYKKEIEKEDCRVVADEYKIIKILSNKLDTYKFLKNKGINNCFWKSVNSFRELSIILEKNKKYDALVFKTANQRGSRNIFYIRNENFYNHKMNQIEKVKFKEYFKKIEKLAPFVVMEKLKSPVYDIDILTWKGKLLKIVQRRRLVSDDPNLGHELVDEKLIYNYCKKVVKMFNLSWLYDCDIMFNEFNEPCLLEINPRKSGSLIISLMAEINLIDDVVNLGLGKPVTQMRSFQKKKFIPYKSLYRVK